MPLSLSASMFVHQVFAKKVASIALTFHVVDGSEAEHIFVAQYDPDNIVSASDAVGTADRFVRLDRLRLGSTSCLHTLSLSLKSPCLLWCPHQQRPMTAKVGSESALDEFTELAKATDVHFVFDLAQLRHDSLVKALGLFVDEPDMLTPLRADRFLNAGLYRCSWETLVPKYAALPAYAESSDKRRGPLTSSPPHLTAKPRDDLPDQLTQSDTTEIASDNSFLDHQDVVPGPLPFSLTPEELSRALRPEIVSAVRELLPPTLNAIFPTLHCTVAADDANRAIADNQLPDLRQAEALILPFIIDRIRQFPQLHSLENYIRAGFAEEERQRADVDREFDEVLEDHREAIAKLVDVKTGDIEREAGYELEKVREAKEDLKAKRRKVRDWLDHDADIAAAEARTDIKAVLGKAVATAEAEIEVSLISASEHLTNMARKRIRDTERELEKVIALNKGAWRRRIFIHGKLRKKKRGLLGGRVQKSKTGQLVSAPIPAPLPYEESTTEDEL